MKDLIILLLSAATIILFYLYSSHTTEYKTTIERDTTKVVEYDTLVVRDTIHSTTEIVQPPDTVYINNNQYRLYTTRFSKNGVSGTIYSTIDGNLIEQEVSVNYSSSIPITHTSTTIRETITTYPSYYSIGLQLGGNTEEIGILSPTISYTWSNQNTISIGYNIPSKYPIIGFSYSL